MKYIIHTKGHYGIEDPELKFSKKGMQEDSYEKGQKSKSTKVLKWHGNEEHTNISVYHMLQSCGVQSYQPPEDRSNNETHPLASTESSGLENFGFHSPKLDYH